MNGGKHRIYLLHLRDQNNPFDFLLSYVCPNLLPTKTCFHCPWWFLYLTPVFLQIKKKFILMTCLIFYFQFLRFISAHYLFHSLAMCPKRISGTSSVQALFHLHCLSPVLFTDCLNSFTPPCLLIQTPLSLWSGISHYFPLISYVINFLPCINGQNIGVKFLINQQ